jgi:hypothetical protein
VIPLVRRARRAALALVPVLALVLPTPSATAAPERQVLLVVVAEMSFGEALGHPILSRLAASGGVGLMTSAGRAGEPARTAVTLGAGVPADDAPDDPVSFALLEGLTVDVGAYAAAAGDASPGLLGSALAGAGLGVGYVDRRARSEVAALAAIDRTGVVPSAVLGLGIRRDLLERLLERSALVVTPERRLLPNLLERTSAREVLVIVVGAGASAEMLERGETVAPIVLAAGTPDELLGAAEDPRGLTSDTTRRPGVVADVDVAPTILTYLGVAVPDAMVGSAIRIEGEPPTELHQRYLAYREVVGPLGAALLAFALVALCAGVLLVFALRGAPRWLRRAAGLATLAALALLAALTPASTVPSFEAPIVAGYLVVASVLLVAIARTARDPRAAVATIALAGLGAVVLDAVFGWQSGSTPLVGGSALDGERFFGLGNAHAGIVLAGAVLGAARLDRGTGVRLIAGAAAFAGLPLLGADLGGSVTLALAAALWFGLGKWRRLGPATWIVAAGAALATAGLVLVAERILPGARTHLSAANGGLEAFGERLAENVRATAADPWVFLALVGLVVWLALALARAEVARPAFDPDPRWRDALVVLALAGLAGWVLNDSYGLAGSAFTFASGAVLYPALAER